MTRTILKSLAVALIAVFLGGSVGEAAPRKVRHRPRHSTRVSSGTTSTIRKKPAKKRHVHKATKTMKAPVRRRPPTKPR